MALSEQRLIGVDQMIGALATPQAPDVDENAAAEPEFGSPRLACGGGFAATAGEVRDIDRLRDGVDSPGREP